MTLPQASSRTRRPRPIPEAAPRPARAGYRQRDRAPAGCGGDHRPRQPLILTSAPRLSASSGRSFRRRIDAGDADRSPRAARSRRGNRDAARCGDIICTSIAIAPSPAFDDPVAGRGAPPGADAAPSRSRRFRSPLAFLLDPQPCPRRPGIAAPRGISTRCSGTATASGARPPR